MKLVKIGATWCGKCKIQDKKLPGVIDFGIEVIKLDAEKDFDEVMKYPRVKTLPTMYIIGNDNEILETLTGLHSTDEIIAKFKNLASI